VRRFRPAQRNHRSPVKFAAAVQFVRAGVMGADGFRCDSCGSPSIAVPSDLRPTSDVCCGGCSRRLATWSEYRAFVATAVREGANGRQPIVADPLSDGSA